MNIKKAKVENQTIVNIGVFDSDNIPAEFADWIDATDLAIGMVDDGNGNFIEPAIPEPSVEELGEMKSIAYAKIDEYAEEARLRYVTDGAAQAMTYQLKGDEADRYSVAGYPADLSAYPFIQAEVNASGKTAIQAANDIIAQRDAWIVIGASIEEKRLGGKKAVLDAVDVNGISTATNTVVDELAAI